MKCSIVIRSFNEDKHIGKLLKGIQKQLCSYEVEVILVDSGSTDSTVKIAEGMGAKIVNISPEDFSFGYALNVGCALASGEFLVFVSAHVYPVYTNWLQNMLDPFTDEKIALVYGRQIGDEYSKFSEKRLLNKWFPAISNHNQLHPFSNNANAAIRKSLWVEQPYDESLTGLEDLDWGNKIISKGYKIAYEADAVIVHVHEETPKKVFNRYYREAIAFKRIMPHARFKFLDFIFLSTTNILSDYYFAMREKVFIRNIIDIPVFRILQFFGTYKGYRYSGNIDSSLRTRFYYPTNFLRKQTKPTAKFEKIDY
jgi:rhamnosyltransferase